MPPAVIQEWDRLGLKSPRSSLGHQYWEEVYG